VPKYIVELRLTGIKWKIQNSVIRRWSPVRPIRCCYKQQHLRCCSVKIDISKRSLPRLLALSKGRRFVRIGRLWGFANNSSEDSAPHKKTKTEQSIISSNDERIVYTLR